MPSIWSYSDPSDRGFGLFKRQIFRVLDDLGWKTELAEAPLLEPASKRILQASLLQSQPDWILLINQSATQLYDYLDIPIHIRPLPQKKMVWYLDDPHFFIDRPFEKSEIVFCFDETYLDYIKQFTPGATGFLALAADMERPGKFDPRFACDVCFVGGLINQSERKNQLPPDIQIYVERLVELKLEHRHRTFFQLALDYPIAPGKCITITPQVAHYLYWEANNRYRLNVMNALADFNLRIYGNDEWKPLIEGTPLQDRFYGPADPVTELPDIFVSAKVNLNLHSVQCLGSLNQRDFNAPLAGGFLLSDWTPAAGRYFIPGDEAVYWGDVEDLKHKIIYYISYERERRAIIERGRRRVLRDHTYPGRITTVAELLDRFDP